MEVTRGVSIEYEAGNGVPGSPSSEVKNVY